MTSLEVLTVYVIIHRLDPCLDVVFATDGTSCADRRSPGRPHSQTRASSAVETTRETGWIGYQHRSLVAELIISAILSIGVGE